MILFWILWCSFIVGDVLCFQFANCKKPVHWKYIYLPIGGYWLMAKYGYKRNT